MAKPLLTEIVANWEELADATLREAIFSVRENCDWCGAYFECAEEITAVVDTESDEVAFICPECWAGMGSI